MARTSVEAATAKREVTLADRDLFNYPFLYLAGKYEFEPFSQEEVEILASLSLLRRFSADR